MFNVVQFQLLAPLHLFALIMVNEKFKADPGVFASPPPAVDSIIGYLYHGDSKVRKARRSIARTAARLTSLLFIRGEMAAPAGLLLDLRGQENVSKLGSWLAWLAMVNPLEAISILAHGYNTVHKDIYSAVEAEYNEGVVAAAREIPQLAKLRLEPDSLSALVAGRRGGISSIPPLAPPLDVPGTFYRVVGNGGNNAKVCIQNLLVWFCPLLLAIFCSQSDTHDYGDVQYR
jgi:hypothetical protein